MKKILLVLCVFMLAGVFSAFAGGGSENKSAAPAAAAAEKSVKMKFATNQAANMENNEYVAMLKFAELIKQYTNGTIQCDVYPGSQLGGSNEMMEGVTLGTIEAAALGFDTVAAVDPICNVLAMPFLFRDFEHQRKFYETKNEWFDIIQKSLLEVNVRVLSVYHRGFRSIANNLREVKNPNDLKGLKIRVPESPSIRESIAAMGGVPVTINFAETYTAIQQNACNGYEATLVNFFYDNWGDVLKYISLTNENASPTPVCVGEKWFQSLSASQRSALEKTAQETAAWRYDKLINEDNVKAMQQLKAKGIKFLTEKEVDMQAFRDAAKDVYKKFLKDFDESLYLGILNSFK
jgi:tripartite ATP-independent transporter DctP family solute receptor